MTRPKQNGGEPRNDRCLRLGIGLAWMVLVSLPSLVAAQNEKSAPEPVSVALETLDKVQVNCLFYPAPIEDKNTTPVILLHGFKKNHETLVELAASLQDLGCSVIALDLRGHGGSKSVQGTTKTLEAEKMPAAHLSRMAAAGGEVEKAKNFLMEKHNDGKANIEKLCVIGVDFSCLVALNWTALDWSAPPLAVGKQGQDVAALVFISPQYTFKTLKPEMGAFKLEEIALRMPVYIAAGAKTQKSKDDAERFRSLFAKKRPNQANLPIEERTVFYFPVDSSLQSDELLNEPSLNVIEDVVKFVNLKAASRTVPWKERKNPFKK